MLQAMRPNQYAATPVTSRDGSDANPATYNGFGPTDHLDLNALGSHPSGAE